ncbi:MAG: site-2 protease family protein [Peptococcaceae bacterium]|nr:site-2 protease family protein [Peptococcaceae bacterium]
MYFDLTETLYSLPGILIGFAFHEFAHAQTAVYLGDDTPRLQGRTTLNPFAHIDIIGFLMILLAHFGWAKPVQINPYHFKNKKRDDFLVSIAGPLMNLFIAFLFVLLSKLFLYLPENLLDKSTYDIVINILDYTVWINVVLFVFNLLPIPPLDGSHIFFGLTGLSGSPLYYRIQQLSTMILIVLIITNLLDKIIGPPIIYIYDNLTGILF